jgi:hypothetical protein
VAESVDATDLKSVGLKGHARSIRAEGTNKMRYAVPGTIGRHPLALRIRSLLISGVVACVHGMRQLLNRPQTYILVVSHMRSGSSLLHHLLQTNRLILGAGESNRAYRNAADLRRFSLWAHLDRRCLFRWHAFVTDQINHTEKLRDAALLRRADVRTIVLIREPHGTIASLVKLVNEFYGSRANEQELIAYYLERINALGALANTLSRPPGAMAFLLTYDELVNRSAASLSAMQHYLGLAESFSPTYETFDYTSTRGDPSQKVKMKQIVSEDRHSDYSLPAESRWQLEERYREVLASLRSVCVSVDAETARL